MKTEFVKFGGMMDTLHRQHNTAANTIGGDGKDSVQRRLRAMERKLKDVESLPSSSTNLLEGLNESDND